MRGLIGVTVVTVAVLLQLAVADRIAFPGGAGPDLVLLTVAALALAIGPLAGTLTGFCAGLALDVAPPAGHLVGQDALVFCLIGYACGLFATGPSAEGTPEQERSALTEIALTAAGAACGEALAAALGVMLSDPRVTWGAVKHVLPVAVGYDLLLSPFVLFAVAAMLRSIGAAGPHRAGAGQAAAASRRAAWAPVPTAGAVRQMAGGIAGASFSKTGSRLASQSGTAKLKFGTRRGEGVLGGSLLGGSLLGGSAGHRVAGSSAKRLVSSRLGASLLGGSVFSRPGPSFGRPRLLTPSKGKAHVGPGPHQPRFRKPGALSRLVHGMRRPPQRKSPGKRWLRGSGSGSTSGPGSLGRRRSLSPRSPSRGWLRRSRGLGRPRKTAVPRLGARRSPARLRMKPRKMKPRKLTKRSWRRSGGYW